MKRILIAIVLIGTLRCIIQAATLDAQLIQTSGLPTVAAGKFYGYRTSTEGPGDDAFTEALNLAKQKEVPLVVIWSNEDCHYCDNFTDNLNNNAEALTAWMTTNRAVFVFFKDKSGDYAPTKGHKPLACYDAYDFVYSTCGSQPYWPLVGFYYERDNGTKIVWKHGNIGSKTFAWLRKEFSKWCITNNIDTGFEPTFMVSGSPCDRYEAEPTTTQVVVRIERDAQYVGNGYTLNGKPIVWKDEECVADVIIQLPYVRDEPLELMLKNSSGRIVATNAIYFVEEPENSPKNPRWIGERDVETLSAGEWTMDRDLVLTKARNTGGSTLTLLGGTLWCPDCVNNDKYLVDTAVFKAWAANNAVYCAAIDEPIFASGLLTPTLLSYESYDVSWLGGVTSGAGYLSRKMIPITGNGGTNAITILARNLNLATNTVANGGLCRPECIDAANVETGKWKTGIPCFIMQNADGEIKGRLFQFSNVSPTNDTAAAAYVRRLEELRQLNADSTEELNRHWSTAGSCELSLGSDVSSTISAIDTSDFWRLTERSEWSRVTFKVGGGSLLEGEDDVRLNLWRVTKATETEEASAEKIASVAGNLEFGVTLADQEISADASIDYFIQLEAIETSARFALDNPDDSVVRYGLTSKVERNVGTVVFAKTSDTVSEADAKKAGGMLRVYIPAVRIDGASGETNVVIAVDEKTTAFPDRYRIVTDTLSWNDGEFGTKSFVVDVVDDANADGTQTLVLRSGDDVYTLTIVDNDKANVGKLSIVGVKPVVAKKGVVIAEEGSYVMIGVERVSGASGDVGCTLQATAGEFVDGETLIWTSREAGEKAAILKLPELDGCSSGKVTVSFESLSGITAISSAKTLTVQLIASSAPCFEVSEKNLDLARYCAASQEVAIINVAAGAAIRVAKLSGSVPAGIMVRLVDSKLLIYGVPTRAGVYEAVYQVSQVLNRKTTAGLTVRLTFTVTDVSTIESTAPGANPSVAKSRTFVDMPVIDLATKRMTGMISGLTIPTTGRCSARYKCKAGTIALSAACWLEYDRESGDLKATLKVAKKNYSLDVCACANGVVSVTLTDPDFVGDKLIAEVPDGWNATSPSTDWLGYYTAVVDVPTIMLGNLLAAGNAILTMRMQTISLAKKGLMSYAGVLPNGQSFSGSGTLIRNGLETVILPVYYRTTREFFALAPQIKANQSVKAIGCGEDILPYWSHVESVTNGTFEVGYSRVVGSYYDATLNLRETLDPSASGHELVAKNAIDPIPVMVAEKKITLDKTAAKIVGATLSFNKYTGMVSGGFKVTNSAGKLVTAAYKGVLLPDWGDGCPSCGDIPLASGTFWFLDSIDYILNSRRKSFSIKVGDVLYIEKN